MPDTIPHRVGPSAGHLAALFLILLAAFAVYHALPGNDFINFDDPRYVIENERVGEGLTPENIVWAFTTREASNWHPLTWISHMADAALFGMNPAGHHLTSLLLHAGAAFLLYLFLFRMTESRVKSLLVALLFTVHPLHVESVAWVAERKDVLSGLFFMLTLYSYTVYVATPTLSRYLGVVVLYALGLMAKPMLVTLPFLLLLLDAWPLQRGSWKTDGADSAAGCRLRVTEKLPLFLLSAASCVVTYTVQSTGGAVASLEHIPLADRMANAVHAYWAYLAKMVWPSNLSVFYPFVRIDPLRAAGSAVLLLAATALAAAGRRRRPYLLVGWLWYLGMLVPVIGLVQVGNQAMADRYTYLPLIGPFIMVVWGGSDLGKRIGIGPKKLAVIAAAVLIGLIGAGRVQVGYWKDSVRLFTHALSATGPNAVAHGALGGAYGEAGNPDEAVLHFRKALELAPGHPFYHYGLGLALYQNGDLSGASDHLQQALDILEDRSDRPKVLVALGAIMAQRGKTTDAAALLRQALSIDPRDAEAHAALGDLLAGENQTKKAIAHYRLAAAIRPETASYHNGLARLLLAAGETDGALDHYREAIRLAPDTSEAHFVLGRFALERGDISAAVDHFRAGLQNSPSDAKAHFFLGIALARGGNLSAAASSFSEAVRVDPQFAEAFYNLGSVLEKLGRTQAAVAALENAVRIRPGYTRAGELLEELGSRKD